MQKWMEHLEKYAKGLMLQEDTTTQIHKMIIQPSILCGMEIVPITIDPRCKDWKWQRWTCVDGHEATQETM